MSNPFQEQLLKAGLVTKQQVQKANQDKNKKWKKQRSNKTQAEDEVRLKAQKAAEEKAARDRELNLRREAQARQKAISIEINQLITANRLPRDASCEIIYNFEHNKKIKRLYVTAEMKQQIMQGKLGIARIEGRYELVPQAIAEKIVQRNPKRIVIFDPDAPENTPSTSDSDNAYADYQVPDDLMW